MVTFSLNINDAGLVRIQQIAEMVERPSALLLVLGRILGNLLKTWFRGRKRDPGSIASRYNFPEQGFWSRVAQSIQAPRPQGETGVVVSVTDPRFAQKVFGGRITPKVAQALAIPIAPEAAGLTPGLYEAKTGVHLFIPKTHGSALSRFLCSAVQVGGKDAHTGIRPLFLLSSGVTQKADPLALPPDTIINPALVGQAEAFLERETQK